MGMMEVFKKLLGQSNEAEVRRLQKIADQVLAKEAEYRALTDEQLRWTIFCPTPLPPAAKPLIVPWACVPIRCR